MKTRDRLLQMQVADIFHLSDGRTVFVGEINDAQSHIGKMQCQLSIDGENIFNFEIGGEMHFKPKMTSHRAVSTRKDISITSDDAKTKHVIIDFISDIAD